MNEGNVIRMKRCRTIRHMPLVTSEVSYVAPKGYEFVFLFMGAIPQDMNERDFAEAWLTERGRPLIPDTTPLAARSAAQTGEDKP